MLWKHITLRPYQLHPDSGEARQPTSVQAFERTQQDVNLTTEIPIPRGLPGVPVISAFETKIRR